MDFRNILLAVDSSENSMRAVDYVGMVANSDGFRVELLCIERLPPRDLFPDETGWETACETTRDGLKRFMQEARSRLTNAGIAGNAISDQYVTSCVSPFPDGAESDAACSRGTAVAQEILERLKQGGFGTVVVGRRGVSKAEEFLFGSVSNKIIHSAKDCTVWVVA